MVPVPFTLFIFIVIPLTFYISTHDKANSFRILLVSLSAIYIINPFWTPLLLVVSLILNDEHLRAIARWKLIVFTGMDGAGKSTHTAISFYMLRKLGVKCVAYHWFQQPLVTSLAVLYAKLRGKPIIEHKYAKGDQVYTNEFRRRVRESSSIFRPILQLLDNWILIGTVLFINMLRGYWVICDRYFYDYYIRFKVLGYPIPWILEFLVYHLTPNPHVLIVFDVNPKISYNRRKGEHPLWYYFLARKEYLKLAKLKGAIILNTERPLHDVQKIINQILISRLGIEHQGSPELTH